MPDNPAQNIPADLRHYYIGKEDIGDEGFQHTHSLQAIIGYANVTVFTLKKMREEFNESRIIFYDENFVHITFDYFLLFTGTGLFLVILYYIRNNCIEQIDNRIFHRHRIISQQTIGNKS